MPSEFDPPSPLNDLVSYTRYSPGFGKQGSTDDESEEEEDVHYEEESNVTFSSVVLKSSEEKSNRFMKNYDSVSDSMISFSAPPRGDSIQSSLDSERSSLHGVYMES